MTLGWQFFLIPGRDSRSDLLVKAKGSTISGLVPVVKISKVLHKNLKDKVRFCGSVLREGSGSEDFKM